VDVEYGDYLNVWRKANGQWRVFRSMYNTTMSQKTDISVSSDTEGAAGGSPGSGGTPPAQPPRAKPH
jgi:hypothetical protein